MVEKKEDWPAKQITDDDRCELVHSRRAQINNNK